MAYVACDVQPGLRDSEVSVAVRDVDGRHTHLRIERDLLRSDNGTHFLSVGLIHVDAAGARVLIELPHEADSGANRLWVPLSSVDFADAPRRQRAPA